MEANHGDIERIILSRDDIRDIVSRMGEEITNDYRDSNPLIIAVLRGAVVFVADLMRAIDCPIDDSVISKNVRSGLTSGICVLTSSFPT